MIFKEETGQNVTVPWKSCYFVKYGALVFYSQQDFFKVLYTSDQFQNHKGWKATPKYESLQLGIFWIGNSLYKENKFKY